MSSAAVLCTGGINDSGSRASLIQKKSSRQNLLKRVFAGFNEDRLMTEAAGVTFYSLLAVFPAMATLVSL